MIHLHTKRFPTAVLDLDSGMDELEAMRCGLAQSTELNADGSLNLHLKLPNTEALTAMTSSRYS